MGPRIGGFYSSDDFEGHWMDGYFPQPVKFDNREWIDLNDVTQRMRKVLEVFPNATIKVEADGSLTINTAAALADPRN